MRAATDVRWYGAGEPEAAGSCHNREEAAAFLRRALDDGLTAELLEVRDAGARLVAVIHAHAPPEWEQDPQPHGELVTIRGNRITEVVVYSTVGRCAIGRGTSGRHLKRAAR